MVCPAAVAAVRPPGWSSGPGSGSATVTAAAPAGVWRSSDGRTPPPGVCGSLLQPLPVL